MQLVYKKEIRFLTYDNHIQMKKNLRSRGGLNPRHFEWNTWYFSIKFWMTIFISKDNYLELTLVLDWTPRDNLLSNPAHFSRPLNKYKLLPSPWLLALEQHWIRNFQKRTFPCISWDTWIEECQIFHWTWITSF